MSSRAEDVVCIHERSDKSSAPMPNSFLLLCASKIEPDLSTDVPKQLFGEISPGGSMFEKDGETSVTESSAKRLCA